MGYSKTQDRLDEMIRISLRLTNDNMYSDSVLDIT